MGGEDGGRRWGEMMGGDDGGGGGGSASREETYLAREILFATLFAMRLLNDALLCRLVYG